MKKSKLKLAIIGVGSRYQEAYSEIIDYLIQAGFIELVCVVRSSKTPIKIG